MGPFHRLALALPLLISGSGDAGLQAPPLTAGQPSRPFQLSVNVDLVVLNATVLDDKGRYASTLSEHEFEVYEDGVRQTIRLFRHEDVPVTVGLVVDHSGSMREKLADVIAAARTFVQSSNPDDQMFVVNFNEYVTMGLPDVTRFTHRPDELARAISNDAATGRTALYDAVVAAQERLETGSRLKKVLLVISDGGDNASTHSLADVLKTLEQSSAVVYTIGIFEKTDPDRNPGVLKRLARATGGEALFPEQLKQIVAACERIARDIRHQYALGYVSSNTGRTGVFRVVKVVARSTGQKKLLVRTRSGYIAADPSQPAADQGSP